MTDLTAEYGLLHFKSKTARSAIVQKLAADFNTDFEALAQYGLAGLRRHRLARLTRQAYDQGALLS